LERTPFYILPQNGRATTKSIARPLAMVSCEAHALPDAASAGAPSAAVRPGRIAWRAALLGAAAVLAIAAVRQPLARTELEGPPRMVLQLEQEARRDVVNDATSAGLKALTNKDSLAATLTGGLKKQIEQVNSGDKALLARIEADSAGKSKGAGAGKHAAAAAKGAAEKRVAAKHVAAKQVARKAAAAAHGPAPGAHGRTAHRVVPPRPVMGSVVAAVKRDREHEMHSMSKALARVALLRKQVQARAKQQAAVHDEVKAVKTGQATKGKSAVMKVATAKALLIKEGQLKKRAAHIKKAALFKALPNERALEAAMAKQRAVLAKLKKEDKIANSKSQADEKLKRAKAMSQKSIQELKLAGDLIKQSNAVGSKLSAKATAKLQKKSENLTEKAVHTMLQSRRMSKAAEAETREANAVVSELPALETKARQSKLVLKVLQAQRKADIAKLKHNKGYQAAVTLGHRLVAEGKKDHKLAETILMAEKQMHGKMKKAVTEAKADSAKIIKADQMTARELKHLRLALAAEKKNVEEDDSILSALDK